MPAAVILTVISITIDAPRLPGGILSSIIRYCKFTNPPIPIIAKKRAIYATTPTDPAPSW